MLLGESKLLKYETVERVMDGLPERKVRSTHNYDTQNGDMQAQLLSSVPSHGQC